MYGFGIADLVALAWFVVAWAGYGLVVEQTPVGREGLNSRMDRHRAIWMRQMLGRDLRIVDTQIMASLQNGTAFFASTSLLAIGGAFALLRATEEVLALFATLPFGIRMTRSVWETKVLGLLVIFIYAFFKFSWSYRLFNYAAILVGATPGAEAADTPAARAAAERVGRMATLAGRHFNRGQRAFFFALGYLGWFVSPWIFMFSTAAVLIVVANRQFGAAARFVIGEPSEQPPAAPGPVEPGSEPRPATKRTLLE
jgi:uncharacterized membrane protein